MNVLEIEALGKHYPKVHAVRGISLSVPQGSIYGILGPNGSGKTTTLGIVLGVITPSAGTYRWFPGDSSTARIRQEFEPNKSNTHTGGGLSVSDARKRIGALLETPNFYPYLSGRKNLEIVAEIKNVPAHDIDRVLKIVDLSDRQHSPFKSYSLGMKQRLAIGSALLGDPEILVLDEPTNGLDPKGIADVRTIIQNEAKRGKTVLLASHIMDEVEKVCTHLAIMKKGELLAQGSLDEIMGGEELIEIAAEDMALLQTTLSAMPEVQIREVTPQIIRLVLHSSASKADLNKRLYEAGIIPTQFSTKKKSLETAFLQITD